MGRRVTTKCRLVSKLHKNKKRTKKSNKLTRENKKKKELHQIEAYKKRQCILISEFKNNLSKYTRSITHVNIAELIYEYLNPILWLPPTENDDIFYTLFIENRDASWERQLFRQCLNDDSISGDEDGEDEEVYDSDGDCDEFDKTKALKIWTYRGKTNRRKSRLSEHCKRLEGGAVYTSTILSHVNKIFNNTWNFFWNIRGFQSHSQLCKFEYIIKSKQTGQRRKLLSKETKTKINTAVDHLGQPLLTAMKHVLEGLNMPRWTKTSPLASSVPLIVEWYEPRFRPTNFQDLIPTYVHERIVSYDEKHEHLRTIGRERKWKIRPY